ncbi:MAG: DNA cytosine methyltransferase [Candidatus Hadarchaeum sp.]|uniref:DNA cytosine methyltransferase n=1 Tax=Candidatus Hadarchaeum sp. TaxID=2883567 RepID=UPI003D119C53
MSYQPTLLEFIASENAREGEKAKSGLGQLHDIYFPAISTYSGGGLMDIGFAQEGIIPVLAVEIDTDFSHAYEQAAVPLIKASGNTSSSVAVKVLNEDLTGIDAKRLAGLAEDLSFANHFGVPVTGVLGGPPCQDFSIGGKNLGVKGDRGKLVFDFIEKVREMKPLFFVFENVKGLYTTKKHRENAFDKLVLAFREVGYLVQYRIINALEYGVPQDRERVFIVGFRKDLSVAYRAFRWPSPKYPGVKALPWPAKNPVGAEVQTDPRLPRELMVITAFQGVDHLPNQEDFFQPRSPKFWQIEEGDDSRKSFKRLHRYRYSPTVAYGNNEVHLHPVENRRITVREALRLQTAPDTYVLPGDMSLTKKFKLVSNGVPVLLSRLLARSIKKALVSALEQG